MVPDNAAMANRVQCLSFWYRTSGNSVDLRVVDLNVRFGEEEMWRSPTTPSKSLSLSKKHFVLLTAFAKAKE